MIKSIFETCTTCQIFLFDASVLLWKQGSYSETTNLNHGGSHV